MDRPFDATFLKANIEAFMDSTITTRAFVVDLKAYQQELFKLNLLKSMGRLVLALLLVAAIFFATNETSIAIGVLLATGILTPMLLLARWQQIKKYLDSPIATRILGANRTMEISAIAVRNITDDGIDSTVPWHYFSKVERKGPFVLLFMAGSQHLILNADAFQSPEDAAQFQTLITGRGLVKKR